LPGDVEPAADIEADADVEADADAKDADSDETAKRVAEEA
jgi:hypothetical protein